MLKKNKKILIVDDEPSFREIYSDRLVSDGFDTVQASNVREAYEALSKDDFDLIMTDIVMPEKTGLEFLQELKADDKHRDTPVVVLSVLGSPENVQKGLELGAADYLVKGMHTPNDVSRKIEKLTSSSNTDSKAIREEYLLKINESTLDARKLQADLNLPNGFMCEKCEGEMVLKLTPQSNHDKWFDAKFICPKCDK